MDKSNTVKLFVGNLALDTTQEELSAIFESYGQVVSCSVLRQFAFVHLQGEGAAERAISELNGREFRGRNLVVEESRGRPLHSTKVFVGNLSGMCTTEDLQELFQTFGKVLECDKVKGESRPFSCRSTQKGDSAVHFGPQVPEVGRMVLSGTKNLHLKCSTAEGSTALV
uniref:RNA-binding protein 14 n=1 Tax=Oncorhynchus kisutch TaxID=8019 RepID=A0A8C7DS76_ONCKI